LVDQKIVSFGQFFSGQTLGNRLKLTNKSAKELTLHLFIEESQTHFTESAHAILSSFCPSDLPFTTSKKDKRPAKNSQSKF